MYVHIFIYIIISFIYLYVCVICICINIYMCVCTVHISIGTYWVQTCTSHTKKKDFIMSFLCASLRLEKFGRSILCKQRMNHSTNFPLTWHPVSPTLLRFPNTRSTSIPKSKERNSGGRELCFCFHKSMASNWTFWPFLTHEFETSPAPCDSQMMVAALKEGPRRKAAFSAAIWRAKGNCDRPC